MRIQARTIRLVRTAASAAVLGSLGVAGAATASTTSPPSSMGISATVTNNCVITADPIAFGSIDVTTASDTNATGNINVTCTNGAAYTLAADVGATTGATMTSRKMLSGSDTLNYNLYSDSGHTTVWGDGTGSSSTIAGTGSGTAQTVTIYGQVPTGQTGVPQGSYTDTVNVTITY